MGFSYFNPNPAGQKVGDCTVRAIAKATGKSWDEVYIGLCLQGLIMGDLPSANSVACDTRNTVQNTTRDIIDAMNCGFRSIDQRLTAQELAAKDAKIAEQNQQLFGYQLAASQAAQNNYLVSTLRPSPSQAYVVANPYCCNSGYNYGCGGCAA